MPRKDLMEAAAFLAGYGASTYFLFGYIGISSRQRREIDSLQSVPYAISNTAIKSIG